MNTKLPQRSSMKIDDPLANVMRVPVRPDCIPGVEATTILPLSIPELVPSLGVGVFSEVDPFDVHAPTSMV